MEEFDQFVQVLEALLGPNGCPWDQKQTFESLRESILEEAHEVVDAVNHKDYPHLSEELGDLLLNIVFYCKIGEKEGHFTLKDSINHIREKLIRRHPHVFGELKDLTPEEVQTQWDAIKKGEGRPSRVPKTLPALARVQEFISKKQEFAEVSSLDPELELAQKLWDLVQDAEEQGINAEHALLRLSSLKTCSQPANPV